MYRNLEALGSRLLNLFVPRLDAEAACGSPQNVAYPSCWQCDIECGYWAPCIAVCRSGCGCQVLSNGCLC